MIGAGSKIRFDLAHLAIAGTEEFQEFGLFQAGILKPDRDNAHGIVSTRSDFAALHACQIHHAQYHKEISR
jgi:hypothetical protein